MYDRVVSIAIAGRTVLVVISSDLGPDRRIVAFDTGSGRLRYVVDGFREVRLFRKVLFGDVRTTSDDLAVFTRTLQARDPLTGRTRWKTPSSGSLGGLAGVAGNRAVFAQSTTALVVDAIAGPSRRVTLIGDDQAEFAGVPTRDGLIVTGGRTPTKVRFVSVASGATRWSYVAREPVKGVQSTASSYLIDAEDPFYGCM